MTTTHRLTVRGQRVTTRTARRYAVVAVRPEPITNEHGTYVAFAEVRKRTDNLATARTARQRYGRQVGAFAVVVDLATGEEVK